MAVSGHTLYYVNTAGVAICEECSDRAGHSVLWADAHPPMAT